MGRKTKITKEMILEAAYELLEEKGIGAIGIKSLSQKLSCSTQPISWQFGSMTELKKELYAYAAEKLYGGLKEEMRGKSAIDAFFVSGVRYISNACDHPNVFRFVNIDDPSDTIGEQVLGDGSIFAKQLDDEAVQLFTKEYDIDPKLIEKTVRDTVIYTHGLAVLMMFDHYRLPKEEACRMIYDMGVRMFSSIIPEDIQNHKP